MLPKSDEVFVFPIVDGTVKLFGGDLFEREPQWFPLAIQFSDSNLDAGEERNDCCYIHRNFKYQYKVASRVKICTSRENSFLFHWNTLMALNLSIQSLNVLQESRIDDYGNIDGSRDLSDSWSGFSHFIERKATRPVHVDKTSIIKAWSEAGNLEEYVKKFKKREARLGKWQAKSFGNVRKLRGFSFIALEDEE